METNLNQEQQRAANTIEGAVLVIAGAGSGKSTTLGVRIANMLQSDQMIDPRMILCLTFTESGVVAMRKSIMKFVGPIAYKINIHTIHGFCNEIIQNNPDYFGIREFEPVSELERIEIAYKIIDGIDENSILKRLRGDIYYDSRRMLNLFSVMKEENWTYEYITDRAEAYINDLPNRDEYIYKRGNNKKGIQAGDVKTAAIDKEKEKMVKIMAVASLLTTYNDELKKTERYDYSDMIHWVLKAWQTDEFFLLNYQERFQYLLVDENQDLSRSQYDLIDKLLDYWDNPNIFSVGDTNQSIYEFNGARIKNITDFNDQYNPELIVFNKNYRSGASIIEKATKLIGYNTDTIQNKIDIDMSMVAASDKQNLDPQVISFENTAMETCYIADVIEEGFKDGEDISKVAVIYRKNRQADDLIQQLEARGVPYKVKRSINVLDSVIVKQLIDVLSFIVYHDDLRQDSYDSLLFRILHYSFLNNDYKKVHKYYLSLQDKEARSRKPVDVITTEAMLGELVAMYHNVPLVRLINHIFEDTGLLKWVLQSEDYLQTIQYVNTFFNWVKTEAFKTPNLSGGQLLKKIEKMRSNGLYLSVVDLSGFNQGVNLMTAHGSKGLEFDHVIIMGCTRNEWEGSRSGSMNYTLPDTLTLSSSENKLESNRRLFYVGMTRAETTLDITYSRKNNEGKELEATQFISETGIEELPYPTVDLNKYMEYQFRSSAIKLDVDKAFIQSRLDNFTMSLSALNKYLRCPVQFYFENIVRVPFVANIALIYGNGVHLALKKLFDAAKTKNPMSYNDFYGIFTSFMIRNLAQVTEQEYNLRMKLGKDALSHYYNEVYPQANKVTLNEFKFNRVLINGVPCKGDIDKNEFDGNWVDVVDYKTGSLLSAKSNIKPPSDKEPNGGEYFRQGVFYKLLLKYFGGKDWKFRSFRLDMIEADNVTPLPIEISDVDMLSMEKLILEVYTKIMNAEFSDGCGKDECVWCGLLKS